MGETEPLKVKKSMARLVSIILYGCTNRHIQPTTCEELKFPGHGLPVPWRQASDLADVDADSCRIDFHSANRKARTRSKVAIISR